MFHIVDVRDLINVTYQMELTAGWSGKDCPCLKQAPEA